MCGIVGVGCFAKQAITSTERDVFKNALVANSARGADGTGVFSVDEDGEVLWAKSQGNPFDLFRTKAFGEDFWTPVVTNWTRWLVGHNRYATKGGVSAATAHPFTNMHIILVHNGTVRSGNIPELQKYQVDSEALCASIAERGIEETLAKIYAAYAIVYYDMKKNTLNIVRNDERPLYITLNKTTKKVFFASEEEMMLWALHRNALYNHGEFIEAEVDTLYTWNLTDVEPEVRKLNIAKKHKKQKKEKGTVRVWNAITKQFEENSWGAPDQTVYAGEIPVTSINNYPVKKESASWKYTHSGSAPAVAKTPILLQPAASVPKRLDPSLDFAAVEELVGVGRGNEVSFKLDDWDEMTKVQEDSSKEKTYLLIGYSDLHPELIFKLRVKGEETLDLLAGCDFITGRVASILKYKTPTNGRLGTVYLNYPVPGYLAANIPAVLADSEIPEHAFTDLKYA